MGPVSMDVVWRVSLLALPVYGIPVLLLGCGKDATVERVWQSKPLSSYAAMSLLERQGQTHCPPPWEPVWERGVQSWLPLFSMSCGARNKALWWEVLWESGKWSTTWGHGVMAGVGQEEAPWRGLLQTLPGVQETRRSLTPGAGRGWPVWQLSQALELSSWLNTVRVSSRHYSGRGEGCWETQAGVQITVLRAERPFPPLSEQL